MTVCYLMDKTLCQLPSHFCKLLLHLCQRPCPTANYLVSHMANNQVCTAPASLSTNYAAVICITVKCAAPVLHRNEPRTCQLMPYVSFCTLLLSHSLCPVSNTAVTYTKYQYQAVDKLLACAAATVCSCCTMSVGIGHVWPYLQCAMHNAGVILQYNHHIHLQESLS